MMTRLVPAPSSFSFLPALTRLTVAESATISNGLVAAEGADPRFRVVFGFFPSVAGNDVCTLAKVACLGL